MHVYFFILAIATCLCFGVGETAPSVERQRKLILQCSTGLQKLIPAFSREPFSTHPFYDAASFAKAQSLLPAATTQAVVKSIKSIHHNGLDAELSFNLVGQVAEEKRAIKGWLVNLSEAERPGRPFSYDVKYIDGGGKLNVIPVESIDPMSLNINRKPFPVPAELEGKSFSFIADKSGMAGFEHSTAKGESLVEILRDGMLRPIHEDVERYPHKRVEGRRAVYFYPFAKGVPIRADIDRGYSDIRLIFGREILDDQDHFYNPRQNFGDANASSILSKDNDYYPRMLYVLGKQLWKGGEFVFPSAISTSRLKAIVVLPGKRDEIIQLLRKKVGTATLPDGRSIESLVVEEYQAD